MSRNETREAGYTLVELMMVVVIVGILAAVAIPSFRVQLARARATEAPLMLGQIRSAQESYRTEFNQYYVPADGGGWCDEWPIDPLVPGGDPVSWESSDPNATNPFRPLGIRPDGPVYFRYRMRVNYGNAPSEIYPAGHGRWWYDIQARGNFLFQDPDAEFYVEAITGRAVLYNSSDRFIE